jgi:hypothetical protein
MTMPRAVARLSILQCLILVLSGCASPGPPASTDLVSPPPQNYREIIAAKLRTIFKDPNDVQDASISAPFAFASLLGSASMVCIKARGVKAGETAASLQTISFTFRNQELVEVESARAVIHCRSVTLEAFTGWQQLNDPSPPPSPRAPEPKRKRSSGR